MTCPRCGCTVFFDCECPDTVAIFEDAIDRYWDSIYANYGRPTIFRSLEEPRDN
jgi:hypothetical protein